MVQRIITNVIDDIDGSTILDGRGRTIAFGIDGIRYEIDLNTTNIDTFHAALRPYIAVARPVTIPNSSPAPGKRAGHVDQLRTIRDCATENGFTIAPDGSIPLEARIAYIAAH